MGTTFVDVDGEKGFWMRDAVLELWLRLLALHVQAPHSPSDVTAKIRDAWLLASSGFFGGHVPHDLGEAVATDEGAKVVRAAIHSLLLALAAAPPLLDRRFLNLLGIHGTRLGDFETARLTEVGKAFIDLLDGRIDADARSTEFMPGSDPKRAG